MPKPPSQRLQIWCGLGIFLLGLAVRLPHLNQSLWYDEMTTVVEYVTQPWAKILAAKSGQYVPNNHVLHTILVKLVCRLDPNGDVVPPREALLRIPALLAGLVVPLALAWPLRRSQPLLALLVAIVMALHPWLVFCSVEARGYSLLLLLGILATNCLAARPVWYVVTMALAIYTVPLAVLLIPAHAVAIYILYRGRFSRWIFYLAMAVVFAGFLYLPMIRGLISYYRHPFAPTMDYRQFLDSLPRYALAGTRLPRSGDPLAVPETGAIFWALPVLVIVFGSIAGWSRLALRPLLLTFGIATIIGMLLPLIDAGATEVRFVPWIMLWFCLAIVAGFLSGSNRWGKIAGILGLIVLISWQTLQDLILPPNQPIREGIQLADHIAPSDCEIIILYLGARESIGLYGQTRHTLLAAPNVHLMLLNQQRALRDTGHLPWVVIYFEAQVRDRDLDDPETRGMWTSLMAHYHLAGARLPGRLTPVAIYVPNEKPMAGRP